MVEGRAEIGRAMVDAGLEAELALDPAAFVGAAGDADDPRAGAFGELPDDGTHRPQAAETTTVSPRCGLPISSSPT
jgi:hypothetical protein